jgi:hypothetical protein
MYFYCLAEPLYIQAPLVPQSLQTPNEAVNDIKRKTNYVIPTGTRSASQGTAPQVAIY